MRPARLTDPPLVAVAHGSRDPRAARTVDALLAEARRQAPGLDVSAAFLDHGGVRPVARLRALAAAGAAEAVVVPLLLTAGYHSRVDLPAALAQVRTQVPSLRYGAPLGPHPLLLDALERRLAEAGVPAGDQGVAVVLVAAGSSDPEAATAVEGLAAKWSRRGRRSVRAAYASAARPTVAEAVAAAGAGADRVAVVPYLLSPGLFAERVAQEAHAAGAEVVADVLGPAPEVAAVLLERMRAAPVLP